MIARGPDGQGSFLSPCGRLQLVHRRLAIIDVAGSAQPMTLGRHTIVFNGEIYNYRELRQRLEACGVRFRTQGDTEVILQLYMLYGADAFSMLRGMFAVAIWDDEQGLLTLCRDPLGIKPLYVANDKGTVWFASQARSLQAVLTRPVDQAAVERFYLWGHVPEPQTWWQGISSVPAGVVCRFDGTGEERRFPFADLATLFSDAKPHRPDQVTHAIRESVRVHLTSDVPVCVFLSGGIDSTAIAEIAAQDGSGITGVSIGFKEFYGTPADEVPDARETARLLGIRHEAVYVDQSDFERELPGFLAHMDVPTTDGINTWMVSQVAHGLGFKVALSGVGGDELFGGYPSFRWLPQLARCRWLFHLPAPTRALAPIATALGLHPKYPYLWPACRSLPRSFHALRGIFMPEERPPWASTLLAEDVATMEEALHRIPSLWHQVQWLEIVWYLRSRLLRDADWAGMSHSLEIRTPLVDWHLYETLLGIRRGKSTLLQAAGPVTARLAASPKRGFETPIYRWLTDQSLSRRMRGYRHWAERIHRAFR